MITSILTTPPPDRARSCDCKSRHASEHLARIAARNAIWEKAAEGLTRLWVYACRYCRGWHLTSHRRACNGAAVTSTELWEGCGR